MAAPPSSRPARSLARRLLRWALQAALLATLVLQLRVLAQGGFRLPAFAQDHLARRLAAEGLSFDADDIWLDPRGRVLVIRPRLGLAGQDHPFASARAVAVQLRRRALLAGDLRATKIESTALSLTLPGLASPTGAPQPLLEAGEFRLSRPSGATVWNVDQASARLLSIPAAFAGALPATGTSAAPRRSAEENVRHALRQASTLYRHLAKLPLDSLRVVRVDFSPERLVLSAEIDHLEVRARSALPASLEGATLEAVRLRLALPFFAPLRARAADAELHLLADRFASPPSLGLRGEGLALRANPGPGLAADLALARLEKNDSPLPAVPLVATARLSASDRALALDLSTRVADAPWQARFEGSAADRAGRLSADGILTPAALELVRPFLPEKARPVLRIDDPVSLALAADLAPGARPVRIVARAASGRAVARDVAFDRAAATLVYEPAARLLRADDLVLVRDDSVAMGSYEMDTETLAYRFLLGGRLRPMAIAGWFSGWWERFWLNFAFGAAPPDAEVDIQGVWRDPDRTSVFVKASSGPMRLRELPLDSLHTRIRIAGGSFDILGFHATRDTHVADGRFARLAGSDRDTWAYMDFDVRSDFPAADLPRLFPAEGPALVAPFSLTEAPRVHLFGHAHGPASPTPGRQHYDLRLAADAPLRYSGFPLDHLALHLERRDSDLVLRDIRAGFATGLATGEATISGPDRDRWLAFDLALADADLDLAHAHWKTFQASRPETIAISTPAKAEPEPAAKEAKEGKNPGGRLHIHFAATGPLESPLAYSGRGEARISGADLARIRLMGPFSSLLGEIGLGFTTVKLTEADARLLLDRRRLVFDELRLTGPSALVEAKGVFTLPDGELDFKAKVRPFEQREGILGTTADFVFAPLSNALEVDLGGTFDEPSWTFTYGPTKLFRRITGQR